MDSVRVRLRRNELLKMPPVCCVCGEPVAGGILKAYGSSWINPRLVTIAFPLCETCERDQAAVSRPRGRGCAISLGLTVLLVIGWILAGTLGRGENSSVGAILSFWLLILALVVFLGGLIAYALLPLLVPRRLREPYQRVGRAVTIPRCNPPGFFGDGSATIHFTYEPFAELFRRANREDVLEDL